MTSSNTSKLPKIEQRAESRGEERHRQNLNNSFDHGKRTNISPFRLPSDDEVFVFREAERQKKNEIKKMYDSLEIWEKKTSTTRNPLKHFKNFGEIPSQSDNPPKYQYNTKDKKLINDAVKIIKAREKYRANGIKKEGIIELVEQKKEVFLVEMTVDIIQKEIKRIKQIITEKNDALGKSEKMLNQDWEEFEKYSEQNKKAYEEAENRANQEADRKKAKEQEYKNLNQKLAALKAEKSRNEDLANKYKEDKIFLDSLTPKEFWDQMNMEREARIKQLKEEFIEAEMQKLENQEESESNTTSGIFNTKSIKSQGFTQQQNKRSQWRIQLEEKFQKILDNNEIDEIEEFEDNYKMYFTEPNQLVDLFGRLEERNLFLIQMLQEAEHNYEELKNQFIRKKNATNHQIAALRENKAQLEKQIIESETRLKALTRSTENKTKIDEEDKLSDLLRKKIFEFYKSVKSEIGNPIEFTIEHTVPILKTIEAHIDRLLGDLKKFDPKFVSAKRRSYEEARKKILRLAQADQIKEITREKREKMILRMRQVPNVMKQRRDMIKIKPNEESQEEESKEDNNEEEKDQKFFKLYLDQY